MNVHFGSKDFHLSCVWVNMKKTLRQNTWFVGSAFLHDTLLCHQLRFKKKLFTFNTSFDHSLLGASCGLNWLTLTLSEPQNITDGFDLITLLLSRRTCID